MSVNFFLNCIEIEAALNALNKDLNLFKEIIFVDAVMGKKSAVPGAFDSLRVVCLDWAGQSFEWVFSGRIGMYDLRALFGDYLEKFNQIMIEKLLKI